MKYTSFPALKLNEY